MLNDLILVSSTGGVLLLLVSYVWVTATFI